MEENFKIVSRGFSLIEVPQIKDVTKHNNLQLQVNTKIGSASLSSLQSSQIQMQQTGQIQSIIKEHEIQAKIDTPSGGLIASFKRSRVINYY